jgi:hypothetical protein
MRMQVIPHEVEHVRSSAVDPPSNRLSLSTEVDRWAVRVAVHQLYSIAAQGGGRLL